MQYENEIPTFIVDLPHHVSGLTCVDEEGNPMVYLNARHTSHKNKKAYEHELKHIQRDDLFNLQTIEEVEPEYSASSQALAKVPIKTPPVQELSLSKTIKQEAHRMFGIATDDKRWDAILFAMLITGSVNPGRVTPEAERTYVFFPVKVKKGQLMRANQDIGLLTKLQQKRALHPFGACL